MSFLSIAAFRSLGSRIDRFKSERLDIPYKEREFKKSSCFALLTDPKRFLDLGIRFDQKNPDLIYHSHINCPRRVAASQHILNPFVDEEARSSQFISWMKNHEHLMDVPGVFAQMYFDEFEGDCILRLKWKHHENFVELGEDLKLIEEERRFWLDWPETEEGKHSEVSSFYLLDLDLRESVMQLNPMLSFDLSILEAWNAKPCEFCHGGKHFNYSLWTEVWIERNYKKYRDRLEVHFREIKKTGENSIWSREEFGQNIMSLEEFRGDHYPALTIKEVQDFEDEVLMK